MLGVEAVGPCGDAVKARVDAVAAVLPFSATLDVVSNMEVVYAPPFASAMDIVNATANALENTIEGHHVPIDVVSFVDAFKHKGIKVLDVRSETQADPFVKKYGDRWQNIPQEELACRLSEVDKDQAYCLLCGSGPRSYEAQLLLRNQGVTRTQNIEGGMKMLLFCEPEFVKVD